jgi:hypothetical protein
MPPGSFVGMILERTGLSALRATAWLVGVALELDIDALGFEIEVDRLDQPVCVETEQQGVVLIEIVHAAMLVKVSAKNQPEKPQPRQSAKNRF